MDRNFILAIVLSLGVLLAWDLLIIGPERDAYQAQREAAAEAAQNDPKNEAARDVAGIGGVAEAPDKITLDDALASGPGRIVIDTPAVTGSINLAGGRIDDLSLRQYREELDGDSPIIRLLTPRDVEHGHYIQQGWVSARSNNQNAVWTLKDGTRLTPSTPVTLSRQEGDLVYEKTFAIDDKFMFTITQTVRNEGAEAESITPYGLVIQRGIPTDLRNFMILHEGPISVVDKSLLQRKYKKIVNKGGMNRTGNEGWVGVTNKYWLAAAIPPKGETFEATLDNVGSAQEPIFRASYALAARTIEPGGQTSLTSHLFGGPKDVDLLQSYEADPDPANPEKSGLGVHDFDRSVDWGNFFILTRPIFYTLDFFGDLTGNFGIAILLMTLVIKAIMFPLANKGFESMAKMKKLQPEIEKLRKRYDDDKMKLQQEMMALYKKEKMNPVAGCLPILIQMPIFYALYKTLFVTIELRHEPFIAWIKDLSAPDPTTIFNLFGLLPFDPMSVPMIGAFLGIGVLPILMGVAMWFQTKLNPPPPDPMQAQIFAMMPFLFTFLFASFSAGLVLYWFWNTVLTILQQWVIMKRNGVEINITDRFGFLNRKKPASADGK